MSEAQTSSTEPADRNTEQDSEQKALAAKFLQVAVGASDVSVVLSALINAYVAVSESHPTYTQRAANTAMSCSMHLAQAAAQRPANVPVH